MIKNKDIYLVEGDTLEFDLKIKQKDGTDYELKNNDTLWFVVKRSYHDTTPTIYVEQKDTHFKIDSSGVQIDPGTFKYEIGIVFDDGTIRTLITNSNFIVIAKLKD